jgi:hypothetical protein
MDPDMKYFNFINVLKGYKLMIMNQIKKVISLLLLTLIITSCSEKEKDQEWISLFNGKNLEGWETYLSYQPGSGNEEIIGVNKDQDNIFSVVDGSIRIDGRIWGALTTLEEFENYHLRFKFKWGEKRYPPRENEKRDSGLLYHCVGPHGAQSDHWMRSHESQIMEGDCGDYHSLDGAQIDVMVDSIEIDGRKNLIYSEKGHLLKDVHQRVIKSGDFEKPSGEWNEMELIVDKGNITHIMNGNVVLRATNSSQMVDGNLVPLTKGKIQFQSEAAEIFYKDIEIRAL